MSIVSVAIVLSFHLKSEPSRLELRMAKPLGIVFWCLAVSCLCLGMGNYISKPAASSISSNFSPSSSDSRSSETVNKYSRKAAIVQTGWRTQLVLSIVALSIVGTCIVLLVIAKLASNDDADTFKSDVSAAHVLK